MLKNYVYTFLLFLTLAFFGSGCISIERNIKINPDGSGIEEMTMQFDKLFFDVMVGLIEGFDSARAEGFRDSLYNDDLFTLETKESVTQRDGITLLDISSVTNPDSSKTMTVLYEFANISLLSETVDGGISETADFIYESEWREENNEIHFKYVIKPKPVEGEEPQSNLTGFEEAYDGNYVIFNIEFPFYIVTTNADEINGNISTWRFKMNDITNLKEPITLDAILAK